MQIPLEATTDKSLKVLLIEDNPADAALVRAEFDDLNGFALMTTQTLQDAMVSIGERQPDIVLLDLNLPDSDGLNGLTRLVAHQPDLPIVVLSGFGADDLLMAREAIRMGAQDFLAKGTISAPELERTIYLAIDRKALELHRVQWSRHDSKTGLPKTILLEERFPRAVSRCDRTETHLAVLAVRVCGLINVFENHGTIMQEHAFRRAAEVIGKHVRRNDTVGILDDSTLIVLSECMRHASDAYVIARKLIGCFDQPVCVEGEKLNLWLSIGVTHRLPSQDRFDSLVDLAVDAAIDAQHSGGRCYRSTSLEAA